MNREFDLRSRFPERPLLRVPDDLRDPGITKETLLRLPGASVVYADYPLILHDFPHLLRTQSRSQIQTETAVDWCSPESQALRDSIDQWLVENAALVSCSQASQTEVNTPISTSGSTEGYRPTGYGRAIVVQVEVKCSEFDESSALLLDVKGIGVPPDTKPTHKEHADGLEYLGVVFSDFVFQRLIDRVFAKNAPHYWTLPLYAIIDTGFDLLNGWHETGPAGLHVRRAHRRPLFGADLPVCGSIEEDIKFQIEILLRIYGMSSTAIGTSIQVRQRDGILDVSYNDERVEDLTSSELEWLVQESRIGTSRYQRFEGVNIQLAADIGCGSPPEAHVVDFGHFNFRQSFAYPILSLVRDRPLRWGGVLWPDNRSYVQPHAQFCRTRKHSSRVMLNEQCFALAFDFRKGHLNRDDIGNALGALVNDFSAAW